MVGGLAGPESAEVGGAAEWGRGGTMVNPGARLYKPSQTKSTKSQVDFDSLTFSNVIAMDVPASGAFL